MDIIENNTMVVIDLELTGFDSMKNEIIEVGAVKIQDGKITDTFSSFVHVEELLSKKIFEITGINVNDLINAPDLKSVLIKLFNFCGDNEIAGFNTQFLYKFLKTFGEQFNLSFRQPTVDLKEFFHYTENGKNHNYTLSKLADIFDVNYFQNTAINSAMAIAEIIIKLTNKRRSELVYLGVFWLIDKEFYFDKDKIQFSFCNQLNNVTDEVKQWEIIKEKHKIDAYIHYDFYPRARVFYDKDVDKIIFETDVCIDFRNLHLSLIKFGLHNYANDLSYGIFFNKEIKCNSCTLQDLIE